jgi:hypothetical protein
VTQGGPLSAKLFNILIDAVVWEWMWMMRDMIDDADSNLAEPIKGLFAVFYVDDGYIASCNAEFLQEALGILVESFKCVGLATNTKKPKQWSAPWAGYRCNSWRTHTSECAKQWLQGRSRKGPWSVMSATSNGRQGACAHISQAPTTSTNK